MKIMNKVLRQELKYFIKNIDSSSIEDFLKSVLIRDENCPDNGYELSSLYFDTIDDQDFNQKLDGIIFREKYRIRIYNKNLDTAKFEIKRKLNNTIEKLSTKISKDDIAQLENKNFEVLNKYSGFEYAANRMQYLNYSPSVIVQYNRKAFLLPFNNIRITLDSNLRSYGFNVSLFNINKLKSAKVSKNELQIIEVKFENYLPEFILSFLSKFKAVRSSISKYALARVHSNTEIYGDDPIIPF